MNIQPIYVTFEQAKLLCSKGFDEQLSTIYDNNGNPTNSHYPTMKNSDIEHGTICTRPEQWMVIEWLRINHNIEVNCLRYTYSGGKYQGRKYMWGVDKYNEKYNHELEENPDHWILNERESQGYDSNSPREAISVAIDYTLNNLI